MLWNIKADENLISGDFVGVITEKGEQAVFFTAGVRSLASMTWVF
jgi:hypothetical protein